MTEKKFHLKRLNSFDSQKIFHANFLLFFVFRDHVSCLKAVVRNYLWRHSKSYAIEIHENLLSSQVAQTNVIDRTENYVVEVFCDKFCMRHNFVCLEDIIIRVNGWVIGLPSLPSKNLPHKLDLGVCVCAVPQCTRHPQRNFLNCFEWKSLKKKKNRWKT